MATMRANRVTAWALLTVAVLADIAGFIFGLYGKFWWFDEVLHAYFFFSFALVLALYAYGAVLTGAREHGLLLVLTVAALGLAGGTLWEIGEWAYDQVVRPNVILPKTDTIIDLVIDMIGGIMGGAVSMRMLRK